MLGRLTQRWHNWRMARALQRRAIADDLWKRTLGRYKFLRRTDPAAEAQLRRLTSLFLDRKEFTAVGQQRLSNDVVVAIAAQACLPILRLGLDRYDDFVGIVVHSDAVVARREVSDEDGIVHQYEEVLSGEAVQGGPVMLSWRDVRAAGPGALQGYNVVIHEFAHVLDLANGMANGTPVLPPSLPVKLWQETLAEDYTAFVARVQAQQDTALDPYGAVSIDEFFAVASESFFVAPLRMREEHTALYAMFTRFYRQDPAAEGRLARN